MVINCLQLILVLKVHLVLTGCWPEINDGWCGAEVRGHPKLSRPVETAAPLAMMDGSNLQLLIAPKECTCDSSPKSHTRGEEGQKPRQWAGSAKSELPEKWRRKTPPPGPAL